MKITLNELRQIIKKILIEARGAPVGALRPVKKGERSGSGQKFRIGKTEDENRELSTFEAESMFPGSTDAWAEIVPNEFPEFPFTDPVAINRQSAWFKIGNELRVAFKAAPGAELAKWLPTLQDWVDMDSTEEDVLSSEQEFNADINRGYQDTNKSKPLADDATTGVGDVSDDEDTNDEYDSLDSPLMRAYRKSGSQN